MVIKNGRVRWFGYVETVMMLIDDMTLIDRTRQIPRKTWWFGVKKHMKSF